MSNSQPQKTQSAKGDQTAESTTTEPLTITDPETGNSETFEIEGECNGWERTVVDPTEGQIQFMRKSSTHVSGAYERLSISKRKTSNTGRTEWRVYTESLDEYGDRVSSGRSSRHTDKSSPAAFERALSSARRKMERHGGTEPYDGEHQIPQSVGGWELDTNSFELTRWVAPTGETISVERVDIKGFYGGSTRYYEASWGANSGYAGPGPDSITFVDEGVHADTITTAIVAMKANPNGLTQSKGAAVLPEIHGIGVAKTRKLQLTGICSRDELISILDDDLSAPTDWNRYRSALFEATVMTSIRDNMPV